MSEAVRRAGYKVRFCPEASVCHIHKTSIGKRPEAFATSQLLRSRVLLYRKRDGALAAPAAGLLLLVVIAAVAPLAPLRHRLPVRDIRSAAWCRAAAAGALDGLRAPVTRRKSEGASGGPLSPF